MTDLLRRQYDEMVSENARLQALVSEQAREIERLKEAGMQAFRRIVAAQEGRDGPR